MKNSLKILVLTSFVAHCNMTNAQNHFPLTGKVGIGTNSPSKQLDVNGKSVFREKAEFEGVMKYNLFKDTSLVSDRILTLTPRGKIRPMRTAFADSMFVLKTLKIGDSSIYIGEELGGENAIWSDNGDLLINSNSGGGNRNVILSSQDPFSKTIIGVQNINSIASSPTLLNYIQPPVHAKLYVSGVGSNAMFASTDHCFGSSYVSDVICSTSKFFLGRMTQSQQTNEVTYIEGTGNYYTVGKYYSGKLDSNLSTLSTYSNGHLGNYLNKGFLFNALPESTNSGQNGFLHYDIGRGSADVTSFASFTDSKYGKVLSAHYWDGSQHQMREGVAIWNSGSIYITNKNNEQVRFFRPLNNGAVYPIAVGTTSSTNFSVSSSGAVMAQVLSIDPQTQTSNAPALVVRKNGTTNFQVDNEGIVYAREIEVKTGPIPDYVFEKNYDLMPLSVLKDYVEKNKHLPGIPTSEEAVRNNLRLKEMNLLLLEKVEELTLYVIELNEKFKKP